jgi:hypothetical protein
VNFKLNFLLYLNLSRNHKSNKSMSPNHKLTFKSHFRGCIRVKNEKNQTISEQTNINENQLSIFDLIINKLLDILLLSIKKR